MFCKFPQIAIYLSVILSAVIFGSCSHSDEPELENDNLESMTLIYAVASNSLSSLFKADSLEMIRAAKNIDLNKNAVLLYSLTLDRYPKLEVLVKDNKRDEYRFIPIKNYDRSIPSTSPERIRDVINTALTWSGTDINGLVLWSHGTSWHYSQNPTKSDFSKVQLPADEIVAYSFGEDIFNKEHNYCNITDLATAIPDNVFSYIWFDCCYMSNIETVYQLRNKADKIVGSPTEIDGRGSFYDWVLPLIAKKNPSLIEGADKNFEYYNDEGVPCTMSVIDTSYLEDFADIFKECVRDATLESTAGILDYSRTYHKFYLYDIGELAKRFAATKENSEDLKKEIDNCLNNLIQYKAATRKDFNNRRIDINQFNGISGSLLNENIDSYYLTLDWYKRVWE